MYHQRAMLTFDPLEVHVLIVKQKDGQREYRYEREWID